MLMSKLFGERYKENPKEASMTSHKFLLKGGYIRQVANGMYTLLPPAFRVMKKIENIIRDEMNKIDGQEVLYPVVMPVSLWEESGRESTVDEILVRFTDRKGTKLLLGISHEEASVHSAKTEAKSYTQFPFMVYQFQTKFRDETRSRGGLMRAREFTMKDGYSYHTSQQDLENYYYKAFEAYNNIYKRIGIPEVIAVNSDNGIMGGDLSHEFMLISESGEDTLVLCDKCDYRSNMETGVSKYSYNDVNDAELLAMEKIHTPGIKDIESLAQYLSIGEENFIKATVFAVEGDEKPIIAFVRGDREINEAKLRSILKKNVYPYVDTDLNDLTFGYIGPVNISENTEIFFDESLKNGKNMVMGSNEVDYHIKGVSFGRDINPENFHDISKVKEGDSCAECADGILELDNGIEVGNIFQLGDKYSKAMDYTFIDENGKENYPVMGCYGIGIGRNLASIIEARHDEYGPIWPYSVAPWQIHICALNTKKDGIKELAETLYNDLKEEYEVIMDDRGIQPGAQFAEADLLGIPIRIIVSPRNLENNQVEIVTRDKSFKEMVEINKISKTLKDLSEKLSKQ